jgi:hypothetical protein
MVSGSLTAAIFRILNEQGYGVLAQVDLDALNAERALRVAAEAERDRYRAALEQVKAVWSLDVEQDYIAMKEIVSEALEPDDGEDQ